MRKLFSDARRLLATAKHSGDEKTRLVATEDLRRMNETLEQMLEVREKVK